MKHIFARIFRSLSGDVTTLAVRNGRVSTSGDWINRAKINAIEEELQRAGCTSGTIHLRKNGRIAFSRDIPPALHQRLRNLALN